MWVRRRVAVDVADLSPESATRYRPRRTRGNPLTRWVHAWHWVVIASGWALYVAAWVVVLRGEWDLASVAWVISVASIVSPLVTLFWVRHNFAIFLEKGPRKGMPELEFKYERDWNGNAVEADWPALQTARVTRIGATPEGSKRYSVTAS